MAHDAADAVVGHGGPPQKPPRCHDQGVRAFRGARSAVMCSRCRRWSWCTIASQVGSVTLIHNRDTPSSVRVGRSAGYNALKAWR